MKVVKYNKQSELYTVVYADGDTEDLSRESTVNLLIEDKRINVNGKPREQTNVRKAVETVYHHPPTKKMDRGMGIYSRIVFIL